MSNRRIVLAGATGDLGGRVARELRALGAEVRALVRPDSRGARLDDLRAASVDVVAADYEDATALRRACEGADIVVSTLAGLREVIVDQQTRLLEAAVAAGVPRFMPSDFSIDFTRLPAGSNRNLNLRAEFCEVLGRSPIRPTSVLNGAFTHMLTGQAPFILFNIGRILCWGDPDQAMDWTTIEDTARYAAFAALDADAPRWLRIAGDEISANDLANIMTDLSGRPFRVFRPGGLTVLSAMTKFTRTLTPDSGALYPAWQGMQYMHNMYSGVAKFTTLDNARYPVRFTDTRAVLAEHLRNSRSAPTSH